MIWVTNIDTAIQYRPRPWPAMVENLYCGTDTQGLPQRLRFHSDASLKVKTFERPGRRLSKGAISVTLDGGFEAGDEVSPKSQYFLGWMADHRLLGLAARFAAA